MSFSISGISAVGGITDRQTFGAAVVSKTLDYMNGQGSGSTLAPVDKETFGAAVVTKTMDYMNSPMYGSTGASSWGPGANTGNADYDFQTTVLSGHVMAGALANFKV